MDRYDVDRARVLEAINATGLGTAIGRAVLFPITASQVVVDFDGGWAKATINRGFLEDGNTYGAWSFRVSSFWVNDSGDVASAVVLFDYCGRLLDSLNAKS